MPEDVVYEDQLLPASYANFYISNGHIIGVAITNPGIGYTRSNPPLVVFDSPLSVFVDVDFAVVVFSFVFVSPICVNRLRIFAISAEV